MLARFLCLLIFISQLVNLAKPQFPLFLRYERIGTKCVCGGRWTAEWEVLSSDLKTHSYTLQGWLRNLNAAKVKAIETTLRGGEKQLSI